MAISNESGSAGRYPVTSALAPAFMVGQLRTAFIIGFMIYIPFLVIDMVVASALMSMGMMMLPPTTISMPFKILLFVLADGWNLIIVNLVRTFY
ncbi:MAG: flagellar type III secretion system pore protein FliP [Lachnospiraceae bacterium]